MLPKKKKAIKKSKAKKIVKRNQIITIRVQPQTLPAIIPTESEIAQPMSEGKELAITKTWVSDRQIMRMVQQTPKKYIYQRPAKGGGKWNYVTGAYVEKVLNFVFGFLWDFEIMEHGIQGKTIWVKGKLTVKDTKGHGITKMQFGRADIKYQRGSTDMLDFGNDLKAASTDALKKCASLLGIASDVYGSTEYKQETGNEPRPDQGTENQTPPEIEKIINIEPIYCHGADNHGCPDSSELTQQEKDFSTKVFGKPLCRACQKLSKPIKK